jgi:DNA repair protein RecN (Recombination protein N)
MLEELTIRNYALIDEVTVHFKPGFNVLSGETGAGKSILIDALSLVLGAKGRGENVREGSEEAEVTAVIRATSSPELSEWVDKYGIAPEDGSFLIRRTLKVNGRGSASVQAVPVTRAALGELADALVDIHGQHEHQSLFRTAVHRKLLDRFAGIESRVQNFTARFSRLSEMGKQLEEFDREDAQMSREAEFLGFAADEIEAAQLIDGEEETLVERQKMLSRHEDLAAHLEKFLDVSSEARTGALAGLRSAGETLKKVLEIDSDFSEIIQRFESAFYEIEDIVDEVRKRRDAAEYDPGELERIDDRLARISMLEKKYGLVSIREVKAYAEQARVRLEGFESRDEERRKLSGERDALQAEIIAEAAEISRIRRDSAVSLQEKTESHLRDLGMEDAGFKVELEGKKSSEGRALIGPYGSDTVEFLLSANRGESPKPLKSVASGGELSRVMLAVKSVLSESDTIQTMIFDEVDTGIGGEVARSVGEHLHGLSLGKQVFCITHLASIAVFADNHLKVVKNSVEGRTVTRVRNVNGDTRVREVARMLAGDGGDAVSLDHAARLLGERGQFTGKQGALSGEG